MPSDDLAEIVEDQTIRLKIIEQQRGKIIINYNKRQKDSKNEKKLHLKRSVTKKEKGSRQMTDDISEMVEFLGKTTDIKKDKFRPKDSESKNLIDVLANLDEEDVDEENCRIQIKPTVKGIPETTHNTFSAEDFEILSNESHKYIQALEKIYEVERLDLSNKQSTVLNLKNDEDFNNLVKFGVCCSEWKWLTRQLLVYEENLCDNIEGQIFSSSSSENIENLNLYKKLKDEQNKTEAENFGAEWHPQFDKKCDVQRKRCQVRIRVLVKQEPIIKVKIKKNKKDIPFDILRDVINRIIWQIFFASCYGAQNYNFKSPPDFIPHIGNVNQIGKECYRLILMTTFEDDILDIFDSKKASKSRNIEELYKNIKMIFSLYDSIFTNNFERMLSLNEAQKYLLQVDDIVRSITFFKPKITDERNFGVNLINLLMNIIQKYANIEHKHIFFSISKMSNDSIKFSKYFKSLGSNKNFSKILSKHGFNFNCIDQIKKLCSYIKLYKDEQKDLSMSVDMHFEQIISQFRAWIDNFFDHDDCLADAAVKCLDTYAEIMLLYGKQYDKKISVKKDLEKIVENSSIKMYDGIREDYPNEIFDWFDADQNEFGEDFISTLSKMITHWLPKFKSQYLSPLIYTVLSALIVSFSKDSIAYMSKFRNGILTKDFISLISTCSAISTRLSEKDCKNILTSKALELILCLLPSSSNEQLKIYLNNQCDFEYEKIEKYIEKKLRHKWRVKEIGKEIDTKPIDTILKRISKYAHDLFYYLRELPISSKLANEMISSLDDEIQDLFKLVFDGLSNIDAGISNLVINSFVTFINISVDNSNITLKKFLEVLDMTDLYEFLPQSSKKKRYNEEEIRQIKPKNESLFDNKLSNMASKNHKKNSKQNDNSTNNLKLDKIIGSLCTRYLFQNNLNAGIKEVKNTTQPSFDTLKQAKKIRKNKLKFNPEEVKTCSITLLRYIALRTILHDIMPSFYNLYRRDVKLGGKLINAKSCLIDNLQQSLFRIKTLIGEKNADNVFPNIYYYFIKVYMWIILQMDRTFRRVDEDTLRDDLNLIYQHFMFFISDTDLLENYNLNVIQIVIDMIGHDVNDLIEIHKLLIEKSLISDQFIPEKAEESDIPPYLKFKNEREELDFSSFLAEADNKGEEKLKEGKSPKSLQQKNKTLQNNRIKKIKKKSGQRAMFDAIAEKEVAKNVQSEISDILLHVLARRENMDARNYAKSYDIQLPTLQLKDAESYLEEYKFNLSVIVHRAKNISLPGIFSTSYVKIHFDKQEYISPTSFSMNWEFTSNFRIANEEVFSQKNIEISLQAYSLFGDDFCVAENKVTFYRDQSDKLCELELFDSQNIFNSIGKIDITM